MNINQNQICTFVKIKISKMNENTIKNFSTQLIQSVENKEFVKCTLGKISSSAKDLQNIYIKAIELKSNVMLSFTFRYARRDEVKNFSLSEANDYMLQALGNEIFAADLFTTSKNYFLKFNKKRIAQIIEQKATFSQIVNLQHDKLKKRYISTENNIYLQRLEIVGNNGQILKNKEDKFKQINKFIEIIDSLIKDISFENEIKIIDMGSGKGYLTFAVYDYLKNNLGLNVKIKGIETQEKLVEICNSIAKDSQFENLSFEQSNISNFNETDIDILISLHACDTATDDTLYQGIKSNARLIVSSPCCHKQIRGQMNKSKKLMQINKFGILLERQAEIITDAIRAHLLELQGYKTNIFEFISAEYTGKNLLIVATKTATEIKTMEIKSKIEELKSLFGIDFHYLEKLLEENENDQSWRNLNPVCHTH